MQRETWSGSVAVEPSVALKGSAAAAEKRSLRTRVAGSGWIVSYVVVQFACQFALLTKELAPLRVVFRTAAFGVSLLFLLIISGPALVKNSARALAVVVMAIVTLSAFNPEGGAMLAVAAHWAMYLALLAPLFWVARLELTERALVRLLLVLWAFHTASSVMGMLQVYFPGRFQPALTTFIAENQMLMIRLASGEWVPRPMGLTDIPGGAAASGVHAALFGIGVVLTRPFPGARIAGLLSMTTGMACIYLSQVRSALVMLAVCFVVLVGLLALTGRIPRLAWSLVIGLVVVIVGFDLAFDLGGTTVTSRLASLVQTDPGTTYRSNRGFMLEHAFSYMLPTYPFGAGLGHWGMMNLYFGSRDDEIGAEVQWVAWILDGGIPLVLTYVAALVGAIIYAMRASLRPSDGAHEGWAAVVAAYNVGVLALCFSYVPFMSASGLEFWLLNAVLLQTGQKRAAPLKLPLARA